MAWATPNSANTTTATSRTTAVRLGFRSAFNIRALQEALPSVQLLAILANGLLALQLTI